MNSRIALIITWVALILISGLCWRSYHQLSRAQDHISRLEAQLDSLQQTVTQYHALQQSYASIHTSLTNTHDQLSQIGDSLQAHSVHQLGTLGLIRQQLDSLRVAYDTLRVLSPTEIIHQDLSFQP